MSRAGSDSAKRAVAARSGARFVSFLKVDGAGNDFVLIDSRAPGRTQASLSKSGIRALLDRRRGVGGDGLLLLKAAASRARVADVVFWNPDGSRASFCGNGARCVARLLLEERPREEEICFRLGRVEVRARRRGRDVSVLVPRPQELRRPEMAPPVPGAAQGSWYDAGVPHWIVPVRRLERLNVEAMARPLRFWPALGPGGTNVDFVEIHDRVVRVRTFERGVEAETLACGSGLAAAGCWAATQRGLGYPVELRTQGGDRLRLEIDREGRDGLWLTGPARIVFSGRWSLG